MASDKLRFAKLAQQLFRPDAEVLVFRDEEAELIREIEVGLVVRRRRKQDALAFVFLDVLLNGPVTLALPIAQIVALVDHDQDDNDEDWAARLLLD